MKTIPTKPTANQSTALARPFARFYTLILAMLLTLGLSSSWAQLLTEDFSYTAGTALTNNGGWVAHSANANFIKVTSPGLTYASHPGSGIGNAVTLTNAGQDENKAFTSVSSGSVYCSFLINVISNTVAGDYFIHFNQSATVFFPRTFTKRDASGNVAFGMSKGTDTPTYTGLIYATNTTYLMVIKYTFNGGAQDDSMALYINPTLGGAEPAADVGPFTFASADATSLSAIALRQGTAATAPVLLIDAMRVGTNWADVVALASAPAITVQPASVTTNAGGSATFTVTTTGNPTPTYQWYTNGVALVNGGKLAGATSASLVITNLLAADAFTGLTVVAANGSGSVTSSPAVSLTVLDPVVTTQPVNTTVAVGGSASLTVVAAGTPTLTYQWYKAPSTLLSGQNSATLTINPANLGDAGGYFCAVTNGLGSGTNSTTATLTVTGITIDTAPVSSTNNYDTTATFTVAATGATGYYWQTNGVSLVADAHYKNVNTSTLTISNVTAALATTSLTVVVTNASQSVTSSPVSLVVIDPAITLQPVNQTNVSGTTANFSVTAVGSPTLTYQWRRGTNALVGETASSLSIPSVSQANATNGSYSVIVSNGLGLSITSSAASLTVLDPPTFTAQPVSRNIKAGVRAVFAANVTAALSYQWLSNGIPIAGATTNKYSIANAQASDMAGYSLVASNIAGVVTSSVATLTVTVDAAVFHRGNLVALRIGDGAQPFSANGNSIYVDQFTSGGAYLDSKAVDETGASALIVNGTSTSEGHLSLSANQRQLAIFAYSTNIGGAISVSGASSATVPRGFGTIDAIGAYVLAGKTTNLFSGATARAAATDGTNKFWLVGSSGGLFYYNSSTSAFTNIESATANLRVVAPFNGKLLYSTGSGTGNSGIGVYQYNPFPVVAGAQNALVTTAPAASPYAFAINATDNITNTIVYVACDDSLPNGGIQRWDCDTNSGELVLRYTITNGNATGYRGLAVDYSGTDPVIYATTTETSTTNRIMRIVDTGAASTATLFAGSGAGTLFRGLSLAPSTEPIFSTQPASVTTNFGSDVTFTGAAETGVLSYQWQKGGVSILDATNATLLLTNITYASAGHYTLIATNVYGSTTSSVAVLTVTCPIITQGTLPSAFKGVAYTGVVTASNGAAPYTYAVTSGSLPASLGLIGSSGSITGKAAAYGAYSFSITATDTNGCTGVKAYTFIVTKNGDVVGPKVTYDQLKNNQVITSAPPLIVTGKATDAVQVTNVHYWIDAATNTPPTGNATGTTNWTLNLGTLSAGAHTLIVQGTDLSGNNGTPASVNFSYGTNNFAALAGTYYGLASADDGVSFRSAALVKVKVTSKPSKLSTFTVNVTVDGKKWGGAGTFGMNGLGSLKKPIDRSVVSKGELIVSLVLPFDGSGGITGTIYNTNTIPANVWTSSIVGDLAVLPSKVPTAGTQYDGTYTLVVPSTNSGIGDGYGLLVITNGTVKLSGGKLADNQNFKQTGVNLSAGGDWPLFSVGDKVSGIYNSLVFGWASVTTNKVITGTNLWIKTGTGALTYLSGFTNTVVLESSPYTDPGASLVLPLNGGGPALGAAYFANGGLLVAISNNIALSIVATKNKFFDMAALKPNKLVLKLTPASGKLSGTFKASTNGVAAAAFGGVVMQGGLGETNVGRGYFLPTAGTASGTFKLE